MKARLGRFLVWFDTAWQRAGFVQVLPNVTEPKRVCNFPGPVGKGGEGAQVRAASRNDAL